jgi:hypothetical protein
MHWILPEEIRNLRIAEKVIDIDWHISWCSEVQRKETGSEFSDEPVTTPRANT